ALSGLGSLPVEPLLRLGDGTAASLAGRIFGLQQKVHRALGALESLEKTHLLTLRKAREMLKAQGKDGIVRDLDGVIAQNEADSLTGMGADPSILILAGLGVWAGWKLWNWLKNRRAADA
ncbi:MAG: hypothetical protein KIT79_16010, partial [Deltaproteobacteria bacterium]|nr:hypothetical protein [Deltaproteobacteria bacterium]